MPASRIPLKRCTAAVPDEGEPGPAEPMPPAKRRRERAAPSRLKDSGPPPAKKRGDVVAPAPAPAPAAEGEDRDGQVYDVEVRVVESKGDSFGPVETAVWAPEQSAVSDADVYRACRNINKSGSSGGAASGSVLTSVSNAGSDGGATGNGRLEGRPAAVEHKPKREGFQKEGFYWPEDFVLGDVVWARSGRKCPAWPALVIDPLLHAPEVVLNSCVPGALCVMFFGYSGAGHSRVINYFLLKHFWVPPFIGCLVYESTT